MASDVTAGDSLRNAFGRALVETSQDCVVFDADVVGGTGCAEFRAKYPDRFYQCGIAECGAIGAAAGYALATGKKAVVSLFGAFAMRAWEIFRLSVVYNKANVLLAMSHVGIDTGPDGHSAQCLEGYACWRSLGVPVVHPCDSEEMRQAVRVLLNYDGPAVIFTGRSPTPPVKHPPFVLGKSQRLKSGSDCLIIASGNTVAPAMAAAEQLEDDAIYASVINVSTLYPLCIKDFYSCVIRTGRIVVVEDQQPNGGLYDAICGLLAKTRLRFKAAHACVNHFGQSGESDQLVAHYGIDAAGIAQKVREVLR